MNTVNHNTFRSPNRKAEKGFTIIELIVVLAIIALLSLFAVPFARSIIINGEVQPTADDINKTVTALRGNYAGQGVTPYTSIDSSVFANAARGLASALTVTGSGAAATVSDSLGTTGQLLVVAPSTITTAGDSFTVELDNVNDAACPGLASQLSRAAEVITVNGATAKAEGATYDGSAAQTACTTGDTNAFIFTFR
ncbi:MAG: prepilin-type N-terminal cleavage/methylation domain-containing protein [Burkholderiaceae bacterium]|nr:MAG: prepilin-type N-terminal cleavage/methylation domain-containing protein [Burkholderiaceae bacterium]TBR76883.1 MAG: prepilin-type N-terminal cleavage/methylation domain-containing protein [Burkholderiaceae bacterium]